MIELQEVIITASEAQIYEQAECFRWLFLLTLFLWVVRR